MWQCCCCCCISCTSCMPSSIWFVCIVKAASCVSLGQRQQLTAKALGSFERFVQPMHTAQLSGNTTSSCAGWSSVRCGVMWCGRAVWYDTACPTGWLVGIGRCSQRKKPLRFFGIERISLTRITATKGWHFPVAVASVGGECKRISDRVPFATHNKNCNILNLTNFFTVRELIKKIFKKYLKNLLTM